VENKIKQLLGKATDDEREDLALMQKAVEETRKAYQADYSAVKKRDWDAARDGLQEAVDRLSAKYFDAEPPFYNRKEVLLFLQGQGYDLKKTKLYDAAKKGLLNVQPDGTVLRSDVSDYILHGDLKKKADEYGNISEEQADRIKNENKKFKVQIEKLEFELERDKGKYLLKSDVQTTVAIKIGALESGLKHLAMTKAVDWIITVGGDPKKVRVWQELYYADLDELLHEFGNMDEIQILIEKK